MLGLTIFNTVCLLIVMVQVKQVQNTVNETYSSLDGIKRLLIGIFTKARKNKKSEVS